jgi:hypothetical protein
MKRLFFALCLTVGGLLFLQNTALAEPPPWAPAHGQRAKHNYRYYKDQEVYHDPGRNLYFFQQEGKWISAPLLPPFIRLPDPTRFVPLDMDILNPFNFHGDVRRLYPPIPGVNMPLIPIPGVNMPLLPGVEVRQEGGRSGGDHDGRHDDDDHDDDRGHRGKKGKGHKNRD